jgi:hypothetical protein
MCGLFWMCRRRIPTNRKPATIDSGSPLHGNFRFPQIRAMRQQALQKIDQAHKLLAAAVISLSEAVPAVAAVLPNSSELVEIAKLTTEAQHRLLRLSRLLKNPCGDIPCKTTFWGSGSR